MVNELVILGSAELSPMVLRPLPGMLKTMVSGVVVALAFKTASRRDPGPESFVLITENVAAATNAGSMPSAQRNPRSSLTASDLEPGQRRIIPLQAFGRDHHEEPRQASQHHQQVDGHEQTVCPYQNPRSRVSHGSATTSMLPP